MRYPLPANDPHGTDLKLNADGDLVPTVSGSVATVSQQDNAAQSVRIDLTTVPSTYLWPEMTGTNLANYVDQPLTDQAGQEIRNIVLEKLSRNTRLLGVQDVEIEQQGDMLSITVKAVVDGQGAVEIPIKVGG